MNRKLSDASRNNNHSPCTQDETQMRFHRCWLKETAPMMILMLATSMTVAMLIATAFGLREETERVKQKVRSDHRRLF
jgi:hypothetical protein